MAEKRGPRSPRKQKSRNGEKSILKGERLSGHGGRRAHAPRSHVPRTGCYNPEVRRGLGAVVFVVGFPTAIAGIIMTVVDADDNDKGSKYPAAFAYVGPILIALSIIFLVIGFILSTPVVFKAVGRCFSFDDPRSFCRVYCPRLSHCLKPDEIVIINQHAMDALKSEPGKSALKRLPELPDRCLQQVDSSSGLESGEQREPPPALSDSLDVVSELKLGYRGKNANKGVRFSDSDGEGLREKMTASTTSSENGSILSLRNCKVHPKSGDIWSTNGADEVPTKRVALHAGGSSKEHVTTEL